MFHMSGISIALVTLCIFANHVGVVDANSFLKARHSVHEERMSEEDVQTSLLAEIEGTFGEGAASSRLKQLETALRPMYAALPKNEQGYLGHATVRYALHRVFVQRHGWSIRGLDARGDHRNSTSSAGLLKEQVPAHIQDIFEQRLGGRGFGLHELAVLAATIEHLVHGEAVKRLGDAFKVHNHLPTQLMDERETDDVLDTYMTAYIAGEDLSNMTEEDAQELKDEMHEIYASWNETQEFVHLTRKNCTQSHGSAEQQGSGKYDFALIARVVETVGEQFGRFQDRECRKIKATLTDMEDGNTGRVRLANFYKPQDDGGWHFQESVDYLRQLGALDETDPLKPRVIIPNYFSSQSNCIASSGFYSVCCIDECEGLIGHLEHEIAAPEAPPARIAAIVSQLPSSSVTAPRELSANLLGRLDEIAVGHGGQVQLHGRLFALWLHHAFPRECPFPHLSGTTNPLTADEWEALGQESIATDEEMRAHVDEPEVELASEPDAMRQAKMEVESLPWSLEEELLVIRPPQIMKTSGSSVQQTIQSLCLSTITVAMAYGLVHNLWASPKAGKVTYSIDKVLV